MKLLTDTFPWNYSERSGNRKTEHKVFTSGFVEGDCRPALGEYLYYNGRYYALAEQRIPYMRDKTVDDRFFILTLFAVAMEVEKQMLNTENTIVQAVLPVGLPRSITAHCTGNLRIILRAGASSSLPIKASPIRWRSRIRRLSRRIMQQR